ncbi:hypothetical protein ACPEEL_09375 [Pasteurella sp. PK-2025]|uniref:hypothetical protein n=1 Tax=Pasteurella sp. PK-2025 TaxID=3413133 RepID=UPI003C72A7D8
MKPINSVAVAMLLSLGIVACSGNGSSNAAENHAAPTPPAINENGNTEQAGSTEWIKNAIDNPDYIHLNATNETIVLQNKEKKVIKKAFSEINLERAPNGVIEIGGKPNQNHYTTEHDIPLNAIYSGKTFFVEGNRTLNIQTRSVLFKLENKQISGHSIKTSENDLQVKFEKTNIGKIELAKQNGNISVLGFRGKIDVTHAKASFDKGTYLGYFAGPKASEIVGEFLGEKQIDGVFVAEKQTIPLTKP